MKFAPETKFEIYSSFHARHQKLVTRYANGEHNLALIAAIDISWVRVCKAENDWKAQ